MKRNRTFSGLLLLAGAILVAAAVGLALLSVWKSAAQRNEQTEAAHRLQMLTAEPTAGVIGDHADEEMPRLELNGRDYIGLIELPEYGVSLPVAADWDTGLFPFRPACYSGTLYSGTLIIGGSGGEDCFAFISQLDAGECMMFTDARGVRYAFTVSRITHHAALGDGAERPGIVVVAFREDGQDISACTLCSRIKTE